MTTTTDRPASHLRLRRPAPEPGWHAGGCLRAELIKLLSLRSTAWLIVVTIALMVLVGVAQGAAADLILADGLVPHGAEVVTGGYQLAMVGVAVLGSLAVTGEYATGTMGVTLAATPNRLAVLWAKAGAVTIVVVGLSIAGILASFGATAPLLAPHELVPHLSDPQTWQVFGGTTFFFVVTGLVALGIGTLVRHGAGAISAALGLLLVIPAVLQFVPLTWVQDAMSFLPLPAAITFVSVSGVFGDNPVLGDWQAVAILVAYGVASLGLGTIALQRRDA
ncbi:MAG TPA: ABC transporter permease subunit [Actinomycetaceae bacterium]|nr:ABC transporter permease subunit [Actinomycetaceae bacterium]